MRQEAGSPTCLFVHDKFVCIGSTHGFVLLFDHFGELHWVLAGESSQFGPVRVVCLNPSGSWVGVGHIDGDEEGLKWRHGIPVADSHLGERRQRCVTLAPPVLTR